MTRLLLLLVLPACTSTGTESADTDENGNPDAETSPIGTGDGSPESVEWTLIVGPDDKLTDPRDLGFDAEGNLWVANRTDDRTFVITDPGEDGQDIERLKDGYAEHFMEETAALSFDDDVQFGSCGESDNTYNDAAQGNGYMGPVLWSTDLNIFGEENPAGLGSHLDMSHESPFCVGIAWEADNAYWVFDGEHDALVRHDFAADHGVGMDVHDDHVVNQLSEPKVERVENAPGHLVIDEPNRRLYAADTGGGRVLWLDIDSGEAGRKLRAVDAGAVRQMWDGADWGVVAEDFDQPGALAMQGESLFVGEWATGMIYELDLEGNIVRELDTDFGSERLYGIEFGPDGKLWVIDNEEGVFRIDP